MEKLEAQNRFSEIVDRYISDGDITSDEKNELFKIARENDFSVERKKIVKDGIELTQDCYWICKGSNWSCNPKQPGPGCECVEICI